MFEAWSIFASDSILQRARTTWFQPAHHNMADFPACAIYALLFFCFAGSAEVVEAGGLVCAMHRRRLLGYAREVHRQGQT